MQATTTFKVGDEVRVHYRPGYADWCDELKGTIVIVSAYDALIAFPGARGRGHGPDCARWYVPFADLRVLQPKQPTAFDDLRLTPQAKIVLSHLKKRQRISPAEALTVYGISRLASCIHEIRNRAGYTVRTEQRRDDHGHKYAKYILAA